MLPLPPPLLSTTMDCPSTGDRACANIRADKSVVPPAAVGTTKVMGLLGNAAWA
jgi:hypothetical protein